MSSVLGFANLLVSLASAAFGVIALVRPARLTKSNLVGSGELFYARMYAARAILFGALAGLLPFWCSGVAVASVLFVAAAVQMVDAGIGVAEKERGMMIGPPLAALVHVLCALTQV